MQPSNRPRVLLVGWDAADWRVIHPLLDKGKMPHLHRMVEQGCMANLASLHPSLSPMLWTSIATGKHAFKHGVYGFTEPDPSGAVIRPVTSYSRRTKAIWNILSQSGFTSNVVGWWPSHPAEPIRGAMVSNHFHQASGPPEKDWHVPAGAVHPHRLVEPLAALRLNPNELLAEHVLPFVPRAAEIDQQSDGRLATCAKILAECATVNAVATWLMEHEQWDFTAVYFDAIDHFSHGFMPYHPPRMPHIPPRDFELYSGVVEAAYRFHDLMLGKLMRLAGPETITILISDHGFHSDHLRPTCVPAEPAGPATEHRDLGIFAIHGPGICADKLLYGLSILDVAPTVLALFGLPVGEDMDGRAIVEACSDPPTSVATIPSWDEIDGEHGMHPVNLQTDSVHESLVLQQLKDLGYIESAEAASPIVGGTVRELRFNLARSYMQGRRFQEASTHLTSLFEEAPHEYRFGLQLAICYQALNETGKMRAVVNQLKEFRRADAEQALRELSILKDELASKHDETVGDPELKLDSDRFYSRCPSAEQRMRFWRLRSRAHFNTHAVAYLEGCTCINEGRFDEALENFQVASDGARTRPGLHLQVGRSLLALGRANEAQRSFQRALDLDSQNPHALLGLARCSLVNGRPRDAAEYALTATGILYGFPEAHLTLGMALLELGRNSSAAAALRVALSLNPGLEDAKNLLADLEQSVIS